MIGRLRRVIPPSMFLRLLIIFAFYLGFILYVEWRFGRPIPDPTAYRIGFFLLGAQAADYGVARMRLTHPYFKKDYRQWLEQTPWTVQKPLPLGPVQLVWEDGLMLGVLLALHLCLPLANSVKLLTLFMIFHVLTLSWTLFATGVSAFGYLSLFGLGLAVRSWPFPWVSFVIALVTYLVAYVGLWQSLSHFPWKPRPFWEMYRGYFKFPLDVKEELASSCGWPYDRFLKDVLDAQKVKVNLADAILISLLIGFWVFCIQSLFSDPRYRLAISAMSLVSTPLLWGFRLSKYMSGCTDPISLMGRIRNGWRIIPGYDEVILNPFLTLLAIPVVVGTCWAMDVSLELSIPAAVSAAWATALLVPPRLLQWRLTGKYRMIWLSPVNDRTIGGEAPNDPYVRAG